jgi:rRNA maturation RNase YbeY
VSVSFHNETIKFDLKEKIRHKRWIRQIIKSHQKLPGKVAVVFTTNEYLKLMNRDYLNHNHFTDVITFDYSDDKVISGDIFISIEQVKKNASFYKVGPNEELRRVIIHGVLHLLGFGDKTPLEKETMRKLENEALHLWLKIS